MKNKFLSKTYIDYYILFIISLLIHHVVYGLETLVPTNINWLMSAYHDWGQHYLGWAFYRESDWTLPLGKMDNFYYPVGTNVGFTDSIPLLAFGFKLISFILPEEFQYYGVWLLACFFLNGLYTYKILKLFNVNRVYVFIACVLVLSNPVIVFRGMHPALCGHWLILASFYHYFIPTNQTNAIKNFKHQSIIFFLSTTINPYLAIMSASVTVVLAIKNYYFEKSINLKQAFLFPIVAIFSGLLFWIAFGLIELNNSTNLDVGSVYGSIYSFNLNSFFNSYGFYSKYIPQIGMLNDSQHEGFGYLGLGMIILVVISFITFIYFLVSKKINKTNLNLVPLVIICLLMLIFSITNVVTFGTEIIFKYPTFGFIEKLGNIFRAVGRFSWPLYYLIFLGSFLIFSKIKMNKYITILVLFIIMSIQLYDINNLLTSRELKSGTFDSKLDEEKWKLLVDNFDEIITYPSYGNNMVYNMDYQDLMYVALKSKKPISIGYVARENVKEGQAYKDTISLKLKNGEILKNQLFVTNKANIKDFNVLIYKDKVNLKRLDDFILVYSKEAKIKTNYVDSQQNKTFTDSIVAYYKKANKINTFEKNYSSKENIQFNVEVFSNEEDVIQLSGWAFLKSSTNNLKDSIFIGLSNNVKTYIFATKNQVRGDITTVYKKGNLDNSGFMTTVFTDKLPKDSYTLSLIIKDDKGNYHIAKTDKLSEVGKKKYKIPVISSAKFQVADVMYNLEKIDRKKGIVKINGWAAVKNQNSNNKTLKLILSNSTKKLELETDLILRNDVTMANNNKFNYDFSGFELVFKEKDIPKGDYNIGILIFDNKTKVSIFKNLEKNIKF
jgi:hypothetical protein